MLRKDIGPISVMGFARYSTKPGVDPAKLIAAARVWQKEFLAEQPGIALHCFLGNSNGDFADAILATDEAAFIAMAQAHPQAPSSAPLMDMLDARSIRLSKNMLLGTPKPLPESFSSIAFSTFSPKDPETFTADEFFQATENSGHSYLNELDEVKSYFGAQIDDATFSETIFAETTGAALEISEGYQKNEAGLSLRALMDAKSIDRDFWHVLA